MFRTTAFAALAMTVALLAGCNKPEEPKQDMTVREAQEAKGKGNPYKYVDPREGYTPKKACMVPPCDDTKPTADTKPAEKPAPKQ